jgi:hypothetical protein
MFYKALFSKKIIFGIAIFFMIGFAPNFCHAFWPVDWALGAGLNSMLDEMKEAIKRAAVAALKEEAAKMINEKVGNAISQGNGNGALFITNWSDFLIDQTAEKVDLYMNDFFSQLSQGRSSGDYSSVSGLLSSANGNQRVAGASTMREGVVKGVNSSSIGGNYLKALEEEAKNMTVDFSISSCPQNDFSSMFSGDTWASTSTFFEVDTCNKFGFNNVAISAFLSETAKQQKIAEVQGVAYKGFLPSMSGDSVITPGSTIGDMESQAQDVGNKIIASANSIPEVIASLVTRMATQTIKQGIGKAKSSADKSDVSNSNYSQQSTNSANPSQTYKPSF